MNRNTECLNDIPSANRHSKPIGFELPASNDYGGITSIKVSPKPTRQTTDIKFLLNKEVLTSQEAADYLGISKRTLYRYNSYRMIPSYVPFGKNCYYKRSELDKCILRNKRKVAFKPKQLSFSLFNYTLGTYVAKVE